MATNRIVKFLTLSLCLKVLMLITLPVQAQEKNQSTGVSLPEQVIFKGTFKPPRRGKPKGSSGAGSRDGHRCSSDEQAVKPLMPNHNYGLTLSERPSIFVKVPKTTAKTVVLTFQDEAEKYYERVFLPIPKATRDGIVSFALPKEKSPLVVGENYQWSLAFICGNSVEPDDPVFSGWVQRVAQTPHFERELKFKSPIEQAAWFAEKGIWYDMLHSMVKARQSQPNDAKLTAFWRKFLQSVSDRELTSEQKSF